jgi:4-amino-4-deoxy-L-arabinose transferase-like glycosyltransferase
MTTASPRRRAAMILAVAALSLAAHLKGLRAPLLDNQFHRQVNTASIARRFHRDGLPPWQPRVDWFGRPDRLAATELPVEMWLHGRLWPVFGLGEEWGRLLSVGFSLLTAVFLFLLLEREFWSEAAFYGAALFCVLPIEIYYGRSVQPEALALFGLVAGLYWWDLSLAPDRPFAPWLAATLAAFVSVGVKLPYAHMFLPLLALTWRRLGRKAWLDPRMWAAGLLSMGGVVAWYHYASRGVYVVPDHADEFMVLLNLKRAPYYIQFLLFSRFPELIATYGGLVFFFFGAREVLVRRREPFWIAWLGAGFLHLFAVGKYGHAHEYTSLTLAPATAALMGAGAALLREKASAAAAPRRRWALAGLAVLAVSVPVHAAFRIGHWYNQAHAWLARAPEAAAAVSRPGDLFVTDCEAPSVALYYLDRQGWSEDLAADEHGDPLGWIDGKIARGAGFLAVPEVGLFAKPDGELWKKVGARGAPVWDDGKLAVFRLPPGGFKGPSASRP